jgi:hypothetical protein
MRLVEARRGEPLGCRGRHGEASHWAAVIGMGRGATPGVERRPGLRCNRWRRGEGSHRAATVGVGRGAAPGVERQWPRSKCGRWRRGEGSRRATSVGMGRRVIGLPRPTWGGEPRPAWRGSGEPFPVLRRSRGEKRRKEV